MKAFSIIPRFFIPPYDTVTREALGEIRKRFDGISLSRTSHELYPISMWSKFLWMKWRRCSLIRWKRFHVIQHPGLDFSIKEESGDSQFIKEKVIPKIRDVLVLPLHSWRFFSGEGKLRTDMLCRWESFLRHLISDRKIMFLKFSEIGKIFRNG